MNKELNYIELEEEDGMMLMTHMERHEAKSSDAWLLDSDYSNHMCANEGMFSSLDKIFSHTVEFENNTSMEVIRKSAVKLTFHEVRYTISNVYWVPELKNNLLSVGELQEIVVTVLFKDGVCSIYIDRSFCLLNHLPQQMKEDASKFQIRTNQHFDTIIMVISATKTCAP